MHLVPVPVSHSDSAQVARAAPKVDGSNAIAVPKPKGKTIVRAESRAFAAEVAEGEAWERVVLVLQGEQGVSQGAKEGNGCMCTAKVPKACVHQDPHIHAGRLGELWFRSGSCG